MDPDGLHRSRGKRATPGPCSQNTPGAQRVPDPQTRAAPPGGSQVHGRAPRRPPRQGDPSPEGRGQGTGGGLEAGLRGPPRRTPRARGGVAKRKDARGGAGGGGVPCPDSHSPPRAPPSSGSAAVPLRLTPCASPPEAQRLARAHGAGVKSAQAEPVTSGAEGLRRMERSLSQPPRTPQTRPPPAPLSHGSCGPSHHARLPPPTLSAGKVIAVLANQRPRGGWDRRTKGRAGREGCEGGADGGGTSCD